AGRRIALSPSRLPGPVDAGDSRHHLKRYLWRHCSCVVWPRLAQGVSRAASPLSQIFRDRAVSGHGIMRTLSERVRNDRNPCGEFMICTRGVSSISLMRGAGFAAALMLATFVAGCGQGDGQKAAAAPPPAVTVAKPEQRTVSDYDEYVGRFTAVDSVEVRARVSGYLDSVDFKDGQMVKQGDLLFTIDKRSFQIALDQAQANLTQARSNVTFTEADLKRAQQLVTDKSITEQLFEQRSQAYRNAQASVAAADAAVRPAQLAAQSPALRAPIPARTGARRVPPANLVTGRTTGNTTLLA